MDANQAKHINLKPYKMFIAVTGGGSAWADEFLIHGGGSASLVGFYVPYATSMTDEFIGGKPREKYVSGSTARQIAMAAYKKAERESEASWQTIGIGVSASLAKPQGEREGRVNEVYLAVQTNLNTIEIWVDMGGMTRATQEKQVVKLIDLLLAKVTNYNNDLDSYLGYAFRDYKMRSYLELTKTHPEYLGYTTFLRDDADVVGLQNWGYNHLLFPGSFNPVHEGHLEMAQIAEGVTGRKVAFELSVVNFDKPPLDLLEICDRVKGIRDHGFDVIVSNAKMMSEKAGVYPRSIFMMGMDTFERIDPDDYEELEDKKVTLLVFPRANTGNEYKLFLAEWWDDVLISDHCWTDGVANYNNPVSSTQIRNERTQKRD